MNLENVEGARGRYRRRFLESCGISSDSDAKLGGGTRIEIVMGINLNLANRRQSIQPGKRGGKTKVQAAAMRLISSYSLDGALFLTIPRLLPIN
jgi:hypothetical protein